MDTHLFEQFRELIYRESGIALTPEKMSLLTARIHKRLRALNIEDPVDYFQVITRDTSGQELVNLLDVISTNVTYFFREPKHFEVLAELFTKWRAEKRSDVRAWCAASSSGEEPYTIAMLAREHLDASQSFKLLATDISTLVLNKALQRTYSEQALQHVPQTFRKRYFSLIDADEDNYEFCEETAKLVLFKRLNLSSFPFPLKAPLDMIFCRNVMIYFDVKLRGQIIREFVRLLKPGGYLFLSHSENLLGIDHQLKTIATSVYQKP